MTRPARRWAVTRERGRGSRPRTEIPLLLGECAEALDLVNPAQLLAEAAVKHALA